MRLLVVGEANESIVTEEGDGVMDDKLKTMKSSQSGVT
jgi:hypothetical protein